MRSGRLPIRCFSLVVDTERTCSASAAITPSSPLLSTGGTRTIHGAAANVSRQGTRGTTTRSGTTASASMDRIITMRLLPAAAGTGILFHRSEGDKSRVIEALSANVVDTRMATVIGKGDLRVSTIEHLMAALVACQIDNLVIEIDGPEVPILDGSAAPFIRLIHQAGIARLARSRKVIAITKPLTLVEGEKRVSLIPSRFLRVSFDLNFSHPCIRQQQRSFKLDRKSVV